MADEQNQEQKKTQKPYTYASKFSPRELRILRMWVNSEEAIELKES